MMNIESKSFNTSIKQTNIIFEHKTQKSAVEWLNVGIGSKKGYPHTHTHTFDHYNIITRINHSIFSGSSGIQNHDQMCVFCVLC